MNYRHGMKGRTMPEGEKGEHFISGFKNKQTEK